MLKSLSFIFFVAIAFALAFACSGNQRQITITNSFSQAVWIGEAGGAAGSCSQGCQANQQCNPNPNLCFWVLPNPESGSFYLQPGQSAVFCLAYPSSGNVFFSGNIFARTGCNSTGGSCLTGDCGAGSNGRCKPGVGGAPPTSLAEFTFLTSTDYYDVSIINGVNVGVSMKPQGNFRSNSNDPYWCATPGSLSGQGQLNGASWKFNGNINGADLSTYMRFVLPTGQTTSCSSDSNCGNGNVCGLDRGLNRVCGVLLGYWTADQVCGTNSNFGYPFLCNLGIGGPYDTLSHLYGCVPPSGPPVSCYSSSSSTCCGCPQWGNLAPATQPCLGTNPTWLRYAYPFSKFLKDACPTCYSFPFDDMSSTFTCETNSAINVVNYQITFHNYY